MDRPAAAASAIQERRATRLLVSPARYTLLAVLILEYLVFVAIRPDIFLNSRTLVLILGVQAPLIIVTLGLLLTLAVGEFDLSVGATLVLVNVLASALPTNYGFNVWVAAGLALGVGTLIGLVNGFLVVKVGLNSLIATLGMATLLMGVGLAASGSTIVSNASAELTSISSTRVLGMPLVVYYAALVALLLWYVFEYTPWGRYFYFVGGNADVARLSGLPTDAVKLVAFIGTALIASFAGLMQAGTLGSADPSAGPSFLLPAFAAAFLGRTAVKVGEFNVWGTVIAGYLLIAGVTGLALLGLTGWVQNVFNGLALLVALIAAELTRKSRA